MRDANETLAEQVERCEEAIGREGLTEELAREAGVYVETIVMIEDMRSKDNVARINAWLAAGAPK